MIPTIDISHVETGPKDRKEIGEQLVSAFKDTGFCKITGHAVNNNVLEAAYNEMRMFFNAPQINKDLTSDMENQLGYFKFGMEHAKGNSAPDLKEFFHIRNPANTNNLWPYAEFRQAMSPLFHEMMVTAELVLKAMDSVMGSDLEQSIHEGNSTLRLLHYPPVLTAPAQGSIRAAAHEDINLITFLPAATSKGLQLWRTCPTCEDPEEYWEDIDAKDGELIVNVGDMLQMYTNGKLRSTTHRVVNPEAGDTSARYSIPFFVHPRSDYKLSPFTTAGEYLEQRLKEIGVK